MQRNVKNAFIYRPMLKQLLAICVTVLLLISCMPMGSAEGETMITAQGTVAIYSIANETYVRGAVTTTPAGLNAGEYYSYCFNVTNNGNREYKFKAAYARIDGGEKLGWQGGTLAPNTTTQFHIWNVNMKKLTPGYHRVDLYFDDCLVGTMYRELNYDYTKILWPTQAQVDSCSRRVRSPYISFYPDCSKTGGFTEFSIDFCMDFTAKGSYFCPMNLWMNTDSLTKKYKSVTADYGSVGGAYCGLQCLEDGTKAVIMSVWDINCVDSKGNVTVIKPTLIYPEGTGNRADRSGEGSFLQYLAPFEWDTHTPYRMLMQQSTSTSTGNAVLTFFLCDLSNGEWTKICAFDLGYSNTWINSCAGFLENYITEYAGELRNVHFWNILARSRKTGKWMPIRDVNYSVNGGASQLNYGGSYTFGSDANSFWIATSGVENLCELLPNWTRASVKNHTITAPY